MDLLSLVLFMVRILNGCFFIIIYNLLGLSIDKVIDIDIGIGIIWV